MDIIRNRESLIAFKQFVEKVTGEHSDISLEMKDVVWCSNPTIPSLAKAFMNKDMGWQTTRLYLHGKFKVSMQYIDEHKDMFDEAVELAKLTSTEQIETLRHVSLCVTELWSCVEKRVPIAV